MNEKHVGFLFALLLVVGISTATVSNVHDSPSPTPTPTPTPALSDLFKAGQGQQTPQTMSANSPFNPQPKQVQQPAPAPAPKAAKQYKTFPGVLADSELQDKKAVITTDKGNIEFEIFPDAPKAASNFIFLARDGFYDGLIFHRVEPGFVIQGGDPTGTGSGGPGYTFPDEPVTRDYNKGIVAMANSGPNTNGSQFFIMLADNPNLPKKYTIFGQVIAGQDVVNQIQVGDVMHKVTIEYYAAATPTPTP